MRIIIILTFLLSSFICSGQIMFWHAVFPQYSTNLQAWINEVEGNGDTAPSDTQLDILDIMIADLKADGIWAKMDALYIFDQDGSKGAGQINMIDPSTYELTVPSTAVTWTSNEGILQYADGCSCGYYDANFNPSTAGGNFAQNSAFITVMTDHSSKFASFEGGYLVGHGSSSGNSAYLYTGSFGTVEFFGRINDGTSFQWNTAGGTSDHYLYTATRTASNARESYEDATSKETTATTSTTIINYDFFIGTTNNSGSAISNPTGSDAEIKIVAWGSGLTDTNVSDMNTAFDTYLDAQ